MIAVYIPCKDGDEAKNIASNLLDAKLIACAGMWQIRSLYKWKGKLKDTPETVIFAKSTEDKYEEIKKKVNELHSYEIPAIVRIPIESNKNYEKWLRNELI